MKDRGYINDRLFIESLIKKNIGINKIKQKCFEKGLKLTEADLEEIESNEDNKIIEYFEKIKNKYDLTDQKQKDKMIRHLASKGYNYNSIKKVIY